MAAPYHHSFLEQQGEIMYKKLYREDLKSIQAAKPGKPFNAVVFISDNPGLDQTIFSCSSKSEHKQLLLKAVINAATVIPVVVVKK